MFCHKCGAENKDGFAFCNSCGADLRLVPMAISVHADEVIDNGPKPIICKSCGNQTEPGDVFCKKCKAGIPVELRVPKKLLVKNAAASKHNSIILAKIKTKRDELESTGQTGPIVLGVIGLFLIFAWGLGLILIIIAVVWGNSRDTANKKLQNEIRELEAELE